jgi:hypothetical protein
MNTTVENMNNRQPLLQILVERRYVQSISMLLLGFYLGVPPPTGDWAVIFRRLPGVSNHLSIMPSWTRSFETCVDERALSTPFRQKPRYRGCDLSDR